MYNLYMDAESLVSYAKNYYTKEEVAQIKKAAEFATLAHGEQMRDSGKPFVSHPLSVAKTLIEWQMDVDSVVAGVLHDVVEDTESSSSEIRKNFGPVVASLVKGLTKVGQARAGMKNLSEYLPQTAENLSKLLIAISDDIRVIIIKLADRFNNLTDLQYKSPEKQIKIARETLDVFSPIADRLGMGRVRMQMEEMAFSFLDPKRYKYLETLMRKNLGRSARKLGIVRLEIEDLLRKNKIDAVINGRVKSIYSLHKKMLKKDDNINDIYDLMALRVLVNKKEDCYRVLGIVHSVYQPMIARIKDYIAVPKTNGYQSLHTTVITPHKQIVEFQIRTHEMHEYAERGLAASFHYHQQKSSKNYLKSKQSSILPANLQWIVELQEVAEKLKHASKDEPIDIPLDLFKDRIFVYSPKGDIYNLPEGSLPLDFAYQVHSKIGKHAFGFMVNNKIHPFDKPLENGDLIEVLVRKSAMPKLDWLDLVTTSHAKTKLRTQLKEAGLIAEGKPSRPSRRTSKN